MIENIRSLTRPVVTIALTLGFIIASFVNSETANLLEGLTGLVIGFWFNDRAKKKTTKNYKLD